ncbi:hypothetical protein AA313_de0201489 [Arthrobotrys entomopaga]|nr:hypothetical protein AA313_de0201489 [Arthrobotrys entomopaga]
MSAMSSAGAGVSIRAKTGKESYHLLSKPDREFSNEYKLHCVPKSTNKHGQVRLTNNINIDKPLGTSNLCLKANTNCQLYVQPKPPPKTTPEEQSQQSARTSPPTAESNASKQFKRTLDNFERQQKLKGSTVTLLETKLSQTIKTPIPKPLRPVPPYEDPEGLLALYEEAPTKPQDNLDPNLDQHDNSRANLVRLCKIAYEKGRKDGVADDRKRVKEEGYFQGFKEGQKDGRGEGWNEGYIEGYDEGYMKGREYGEKKIEKEINETIAELTQNPNALLMTRK